VRTAWGDDTLSSAPVTYDWFIIEVPDRVMEFCRFLEVEVTQRESGWYVIRCQTPVQRRVLQTVFRAGLNKSSNAGLENPTFIDTNIRLASMRQIHCAIEHFHRGDFEAAITLAGAAEGILPAPKKPFLFEKVKALAPEPSKDPVQSDGANDVVVWLKHGKGPDGKPVENAKILEIEMYELIIRAISKFQAMYDEQSSEMKQFLTVSYERLSIHEP
jgi:hypothetical protein